MGKRRRSKIDTPAFLYGKNSVMERLRAEPGSIKRIYLENGFDASGMIEAIESARIPVKRLSEKELYRIKRADRIQGIIAEADAFKYTPLEQFFKEPGRLSLICLDNLNDPHNLGSIIRIAACFGGFGIVIPRHASCGVNDTVIHVASGGENFVPVSMAANLPEAMRKAKKAGYWITGAVVEEGEDIDRVQFPEPVCLVLGSEGKGIRHGVKKEIDLKVSLPMKGAALSFNVAMAAAIFCHEIAKLKKKR